MRTPTASDRRRHSLGERKSRDKRLTFRDLRLRQGLTQNDLAELCGLHRNSIRKIESGQTREIKATHAKSLAAALKVSVDALGLRIASPAPSVKLRELTPEQREVVAEFLSLAPEEFALLRDVLNRLRNANDRRRQTP
jgi:transcriptional regulator with XRE-family HTH domain